MQRSLWSLVADVGGTHARFALCQGPDAPLECIETLYNDDFPSLEAAAGTYLARHGEHVVQRGCLALACPVQGERIRLTNRDWAFSREGLRESLQFEELRLVNDFTAMALGAVGLPDAALLPLGGGSPAVDHPVLVIGPGTGLGLCSLVPFQGTWRPLPGEGGHVDLVAVSPEETAVLAVLQQYFGRVSAERALSGAGLENLYRACTQLAGQSPLSNPRAPEITTAALDGTDPLAVQTLTLFFSFLGRVAGNAALTLGALGGVYLCGGILPRLAAALVDSSFRQTFEDKGRMQAYLQEVPVWLVQAEHVGLQGAAHALSNPHVP